MRCVAKCNYRLGRPWQFESLPFAFNPSRFLAGGRTAADSQTGGLAQGQRFSGSPDSDPRTQLAAWSAGSSPRGSVLWREGEQRRRAPLGPWLPPADAPAGMLARRTVPTSSPESGGRAGHPFLAGNIRKPPRGRGGGNAAGHPGRVRSTSARSYRKVDWKTSARDIREIHEHDKADNSVKWPRGAGSAGSRPSATRGLQSVTPAAHQDPPACFPIHRPTRRTVNSPSSGILAHPWHNASSFSTG